MMSTTLSPLKAKFSQGKINWPVLLNEKIKREAALLHPQWHQAWQALELPLISCQHKDYQQSAVVLGRPEDLCQKEVHRIEHKAKALCPWRKGPFQLFSLSLDAEWRSDKKWERLQSHLPPLKNKAILDIGCNNGYFMFRMLNEAPKFVLGIDPGPLNYFQYKFLQHFANEERLHYELWGIENLPNFSQCFDIIFSMGILYHHRSPLQQLADKRNALAPGGKLILETIVIPGEETSALCPEKRYARMKNVHFVPTVPCLLNWLRRSQFKNIKIIFQHAMTPQEQRKTSWCPENFQSYQDFIDPQNPHKTIEGYPAPHRIGLVASL